MNTITFTIEDQTDKELDDLALTTWDYLTNVEGVLVSNYEVTNEG